MGVKIFCDSCQKYIRDAHRSEMAELKGTEICEDCSAHASAALADVDKIRKRMIHQIEKIAGTGIAEIEDVMRRVIKRGDDD